MEYIEKFYKVVDGVLSPIVNRLVSSKVMSDRLDNEKSAFDDTRKDYTEKTLGAIHDRASTMVSHLSLMLAVCFFLYERKDFDNLHIVIQLALTVDTLIYILLVLLSIRCLRSIGLDRDLPKKDEYFDHVHQEMVYKYSIMEIVNSTTIAATIFLTGIFLFLTYA